MTAINVDVIVRENDEKVNALERILKLVPGQCADIVPDGHDFALATFYGGCLLVSRRGAEWNYFVHTPRDAVASVQPLSARQVAERFPEYGTSVSIAELAQVIASNIAKQEASLYEARRTQELTKAFREA